MDRKLEGYLRRTEPPFGTAFEYESLVRLLEQEEDAKDRLG